MNFSSAFDWLPFNFVHQFLEFASNAPAVFRLFLTPLVLSPNKCNAVVFHRSERSVLRFRFVSFDGWYNWKMTRPFHRPIPTVPRRASILHATHYADLYVRLIFRFLICVSHTVNGELMIIRSCAWASDSRNDDGPCAINTPANIRIEHCSTCDQDLCNGAASVGGTALLSVVLIVAAKLMAATL